VTLNVNDYLASIAAPVPINISVKVEADQPIVAERPLYFSTAAWDGGTDVVGATAPATRWRFAEGTVRSGYQEYVTLQNAAAVPTTATLTFQPGTVAPLTLQVPAFSRVTVDVNALAGGRADDLSVVVDAAQPIVVERPLYFSTPQWDGGTDVVGAAG
jgi:hypothetical protein